MQHMKPLRMEFHEQGDDENPQDIKHVAAYPSEGNKPQFMNPSASHGEDEAGPDEHLLESRTAPDDG